MGEINSVDVSKIMEEIRADIAEKGYTDDILEFSDIVNKNDPFCHVYNAGDMKEKITELEFRYDVKPDHVVEGKGKFFKKVVRKSARFHINPIVAEQNAFNLNTVQMMHMLSAYIEKNEKEKDELRKEIKELSQKLKKYEDK